MGNSETLTEVRHLAVGDRSYGNLYFGSRFGGRPTIVKFPKLETYHQIYYSKNLESSNGLGKQYIVFMTITESIH